MSYHEVRRDFAYGIFVLGLSLFVIFITFWTVKVVDSPISISGRTFPWLISLAMFLIGVNLVWVNARKLRAFKPTERVRTSLVPPNELKRITIYLVAICLYILGMEYIGYVVSTIVITIFLMLFSGATNRMAVVIIGTILPLVMWFCFHVLVEVQFPQALLV